MFRTVLLSIIRKFFHCTHSNGICHTGPGRSVLILLASYQQPYMTYIIAVCTVKKPPDDGERNCSKHVEFYSKYKCEKLVYLVGFIIRIL